MTARAQAPHNEVEAEAIKVVLAWHMPELADTGPDDDAWPGYLTSDVCKAIDESREALKKRIEEIAADFAATVDTHKRKQQAPGGQKVSK